MKMLSVILLVSGVSVWAQALAADVESEEAVSEIIPLMYVSASDVAATLNSLGKQQPRESAANYRNQTWSQFVERTGIRNEPPFSGETSIRTEERINSLIVVGSAQNIPRIKELVSRLDIPPSQVLIEALVIEIPMKGINHSIIKKRVKTSEGQPDPFEISASNAEMALAVSNLVASAITNALQQEPAGLRFLGKVKDDLDHVTGELAKDSRVRVLQRPRIQTSVGAAGRFFLGAAPAPPYGTAYCCCGCPQQRGNRTDSSLQETTLEATPFLDSFGSVLLGVQETTESVTGTVTITNVGEVPVFRQSQHRAMAKLEADDILVLGALIDTIERRTPPDLSFLQSIPVLDDFATKGLDSIYRSLPLRRGRSEMVILIRATPIPAPELSVIATHGQDKQ